MNPDTVVEGSNSTGTVTLGATAPTGGVVGLRGNLDEGEPHGTPGTYLNGLFEFQSAASVVIDAWREAGLVEKLEETGTPVRATLDVKPRNIGGQTSVRPTLTIREDLS